MTESSTKKNLKKNSEGSDKLVSHFNYALMLAVVSLALLAVAFGALYFILFVEIKDLKSELNTKLSRSTFLSEKAKIKNSHNEYLKSEKEFLLSKINIVSDLVKNNSEDLEKKISAASIESLNYIDKNKTERKTENINKGLSKNQINRLEDFQLKYKSQLESLQQRISQNQALIEQNKKSLSILRSSYQNMETKQTLEISQELLTLIEEFAEISYSALKNEIKANQKKDWKHWITSYLNTVFISRSTQPIDGE